MGIAIVKPYRSGISSEVWEPKPFYECSLSDMVRMTRMHYNNELNISDYWTVGDVSESAPIDISAISATDDVNDVYPSETINVRIIGIEHDDLTTPINGHTKACVTLEFVHSFGASGGHYIWGNSTSISNNMNWDNCPRRTWLDTTVLAALPSAVRSGAVQVNKVCAADHLTTDTMTVPSKLFLLSEYEVYGRANTSPYGSCIAQEGECYAWYGLDQNPSNIKYDDVYHLSPSVDAKPWFRSPAKEPGGSCWCLRYYAERAGTLYGYDQTGGIRPAFCL